MGRVLLFRMLTHSLGARLAGSDTRALERRAILNTP
jgi:hypothetical protein